MSWSKNLSYPETLVAALEHCNGAQAPGWVQEIRAEARERFLAAGLPTPAQEEWKYTSLAALAERNYQWEADRSESGVRKLAASGVPAGNRLALIDGTYSAAASSIGSLPAGVWVGSLAEALQQQPPWLRAKLAQRIARDNSLVDLNLAHLGEGAVIYLPSGARFEDVIHVVVWATQQGERPNVSHPRLLVCLEDDCALTLVEEYRSLHRDTSYYNNGVTEVSLGQGSSLRHIRVLRESSGAHHTSLVKVKQHADSRYHGHQLTLAGELVRADTHVDLVEPGAQCDLRGLYATSGTMHVDHHTAVEHQVPNCLSAELYKGVLAQQSRAVFNGRIVVYQDAQKTVSSQQNPNLLLSADARIDTKPELEIYADDVKCTHGATIGRIDPSALFYLRSRGLREAEARAMLVKAFAAEITEGIGLPEYSSELNKELFQGEDSPFREAQ